MRQLYGLAFVRKEDPTGDIVPGTVGNTNLAVRNSQVISLMRHVDNGDRCSRGSDIREGRVEICVTVAS